MTRGGVHSFTVAEKSNQILETKVGPGGAGTTALSPLFNLKRACEPLVTKYGVMARLGQVLSMREKMRSVRWSGVLPTQLSSRGFGAISFPPWRKRSIHLGQRQREEHTFAH